MLDAAIAVEGLAKTFGTVRAVDGVSFTVSAGTLLALLGPNGAGKTTTMECIEGFSRPDRGSVRVLGHDPVSEHNAVVARMGVMLQEGGAYQTATPREMLWLAARLYADPLEPDALLERVGLAGPPAAARYRSLSGGQKQRLNLALALVGRPGVALLDEPTAGMDPAARRATWEFLRELRADGVALLLTTHLVEEAEQLADRVGVLHRGRLLALDTPAALVAGVAGERLIVTTGDDVEPEALACAVGARVEYAGPGRLLVHAGGGAIPVVSAWFADRGLALTGIGPAGGGLEEVLLRLTEGSQPREPR